MCFYFISFLFFLYYYLLIRVLCQRVACFCLYFLYYFYALFSILYYFFVKIVCVCGDTARPQRLRNVVVCLTSIVLYDQRSRSEWVSEPYEPAANGMEHKRPCPRMEARGTRYYNNLSSMPHASSYHTYGVIHKYQTQSLSFNTKSDGTLNIFLKDFDFPESQYLVPVNRPQINLISLATRLAESLKILNSDNKIMWVLFKKKKKAFTRWPKIIQMTQHMTLACQ